MNSLRSRAGQFRRKSNENEITCHMCHMIDHMINVINMPERIIEKLKMTCNLKNLPGVPFYNCTSVWLLYQVLMLPKEYFLSLKMGVIFISEGNFHISIKFYSISCCSHPWRIFYLTESVSLWSWINHFN